MVKLKYPKVLKCVFLAVAVFMLCLAVVLAGSPDRTPPAVPTNASVTALSPYSAKVMWTASTDNVGVTGYKLFRDGAQVGTSTITSFTDNTVLPLTNYTYTVSAYDAAGNNSMQSAGAGVTMPRDSSDTIPPTTPTNLTANALCADYVFLNWTASTDNVRLLGYRVYRNSTLIATTAINSFLDATTVRNTSYSYYVVAYDVGDNNSNPSNTVNVTTPNYSKRDIALHKPYTSSMAASSSYPDTNGTELTDGLYGSGDYTDANWQGRTLSSSYYTQTVDLGQSCTLVVLTLGFCNNPTGGLSVPATVEFLTSNDGNNFLSVGMGVIQAPVGNNTKFKLTLANMPSARYVRAKVSGNGWIFTDEFEIWGPPPPGSDTTPPTTPANLTATADVSSWVKLNWTASTDNVGVTGYNIFRNSIKIATSTTNKFRDTTASRNTTYTYTVSAYDAEANESGFSNSASYTTPANPVAAKILMGAFIQPSLTDTWGAGGFATEFGYMRNLYMDHIIWQWTTDSKNNITWYPTTMPGFSQHNTYDAVGVSLEQAKLNGIKVWLGLNWTDDWWNKYGNDYTWLQNQFNISKNVAQELWNLYGSSYADTIAGFYMTMEVDNVNFKTTTAQDNMKNVYTDTANYIHTNCGGKPVMVAPFYNEFASGGQTPAQYAGMWSYILATAPIDVINLQDGIGCDHTTVSTVGNWFFALQNAIASTRPASELWSDLETYGMSGSSYIPAAESRIENQINAEYSYITKFSSFSFDHYQSPQQGFTSQFNNYKAYVDNYMLSTQ